MEKKKNLTLLVIGLLAVVALSFGASYAYFVSRINQEGEGSNVGGSTATKEDTVVTTTGSIGFEDTNIYPGHKNISKIVVTATGDSHVIYNLAWNGTNTLNTTINYRVYKTTIEETPSITCKQEAVVENGKIKYKETCEENLTNLGEVVSEGTIESSGSNTKVKIIKNEEIDATNTGAKVYYYIVLEYPNKEDTQNLDMNGSFTGNINVELLEKKEYVPASTTLIAKNEMVHETFTSDSGELVDTGYRYEGSNPNNYVTFNNEIWRIIGVFDVETSSGEIESLVKLIRDGSIGNIIWDSNGSNDWTESDLKTILNEQYYNGEDINYTYRGGSEKNVSIAGVSLNDTARNMIENVKWNIGGNQEDNVTVSEMYVKERGTVGTESNPTVATWIGHVGLMYPSDYGYAADSAPCSRTTQLWNYNNTSCKTNNWLLYSSNYAEWTITPHYYSGAAVNILNNGSVYLYNEAGTSVGTSNEVRPTLYLKSNVSIVDNGRDGSYGSGNSYELELN